MSADYLTSECALPIHANGSLASEEEARPVLLQRIARLDDGTLLDAADWYDGSLSSADEMREHLKAMIDELFTDTNESFVTVHDERPYLQTGGMSWGEPPTDCFGPLVTLSITGITDKPIDGQRFTPPRLHAALKAYALSIGLPLNATAVGRAIDAWEKVQFPPL
jgi:predicted proteasome-type protease